MNFSATSLLVVYIMCSCAMVAVCQDVTWSQYPVVFAPDPGLPRQPISVSIALRNVGPDTVHIDSLVIRGSQAASFRITSPAAPYPVIVRDSSIRVMVVYDPRDSTDTARAVLQALCSVHGDRATASTVLLYVRPAPPPVSMALIPPQRVRVDGGATVRIVYDTDDVALLAHGTLVLTYNATVLMPVRNDTTAVPDLISSGMRTTHYELDRPTDGRDSLAFRVLLGNTSYTSMVVDSVVWYDDEERRLDVTMPERRFVIDVVDAHGYEVDVAPGPLQLAVAALPVRSTSTVTYRCGSGPALLQLFDARGVMVADLSHRLVGEHGSFLLESTLVPRGSYRLRLSSASNVRTLGVVFE